MNLLIHVGIKYLRSVNKIEMDADAAVAEISLEFIRVMLAERPPSDSISLAVLSSTGQVSQALMSETVCQKVT